MEKEIILTNDEALVDSEQEPPSAKITKDFPIIGQKSKEFKHKYFSDAGEQDWNDWHWQIRNSFTSLEQLQDFLNLSENEKKVKENQANLPVRITPYYASLLDFEDDSQPLRKSVVPVMAELIISPGESPDPLNEHMMQKVDCIVHRYPDRVLFLVTDFCSTYCRYCTRSHSVAKKESHHARKSEWQEAFQYISEHKEVRDVLISGGDPLTLADAQIEYLLSNLRKIEHVEIIRIGTKVPVVLPQRITPKLINILKKYHPLFMSIHFTHPDELTPETQFACKRLADAGIPLGSQTVLLKGINDDADIYKSLVHGLLKIRVKPYYLYQCDPIPGSAHFRTSVEKGLEIMRKLRGFTSGYAIPYYVIDAPGGGGKIPLLPDYYQGKDQDGNVVLKNYEDKLFKYPDYV